jgi:hypothetical protein
MFVGVMSTEIDKVFINHGFSTRDEDALLGHTRFPKTNAFRETLSSYHEQLLTKLDAASQEKLATLHTTCTQHLSERCTLEKKMYNGNKRYYLLQQQQVYLDYRDFKEELPKANYIFCSTSNTKVQSLGKHTDQQTGISLITEPKIPAVAKHMQTYQAVQYALSASKDASQKLFHYLIENNIHTTHTIVAENIT